MKPSEFFAQHAVFSAAEFAQMHQGVSASRDSALAYHEKHGHLLRVRRGLYVTVPPGTSPEQVAVDSYALTAKLAPDAVLAYHTALLVECEMLQGSRECEDVDGGASGDSGSELDAGNDAALDMTHAMPSVGSGNSDWGSPEILTT